MSVAMKKNEVTALEGWLDDEDVKALNEAFNIGKIGFHKNLSTFKTKSGRSYLVAYRHKTAFGDSYWARIERSKKEGYGDRAVTFEIKA